MLVLMRRQRPCTCPNLHSQIRTCVRDAGTVSISVFKWNEDPGVLEPHHRNEAQGEEAIWEKIPLLTDKVRS